MRHNEVQQSPQFLERVLQRRAGHQQPVVGVEVLQTLVQQRVVVLEPMSLVNNQAGPVQVSQEVLRNITQVSLPGNSVCS